MKPIYYICDLSLKRDTPCLFNKINKYFIAWVEYNFLLYFYYSIFDYNRIFNLRVHMYIVYRVCSHIVVLKLPHFHEIIKSVSF